MSAQNANSIYLPAVLRAKPMSITPLIHIPFFSTSNIKNGAYDQMSVFWFGKVSPRENYMHVRTGYNAQQVSIEVNTYDREIWYDETSPSAAEVSMWDGASIYFFMPATTSSASRLLRYDAQVNHWESRASYQAAFEKTSNGWKSISASITTEVILRGEGINSAPDDKGWIIFYDIPFSSMGLSGAPKQFSEWKMGVQVYDQDTGPGGAVLKQAWPAGFNENNPETFGRIMFDYSPYNPPRTAVAGQTVIRQSDTQKVPDGSVGGYSTCGGSLDYWSEWGDAVYNTSPENEVVVIQNQKDVADFPCFSRYYLTFPLDRLPAGKTVLSAKLTLHQFGNSNLGSKDDPDHPPQPSYIHIYRVKDAWVEDTLSWNNSPQVYENFPGIWVDPLPAYPGVPGVARTWDVTQALATNLVEGQTVLRLAMQSPDWAMHSGKYFWSSETVSWSTLTPPTLVVEWANP